MGRYRLRVLSQRLQKRYREIVFVIVEGKKDHQGKDKNLNFKIEKFENFKDKIRYIVVDNFPKSDYAWDLEHHQRNAISKGLFDAAEDDIIIVSDVDEIPNPLTISSFLTKNKYLNENELKLNATYQNYF